MAIQRVLVDPDQGRRIRPVGPLLRGEVQAEEEEGGGAGVRVPPHKVSSFHNLSSTPAVKSAGGPDDGSETTSGSPTASP